MKIGIIAPPWVPVPPVAYGGTELVIDTLARGLAVAGHDVELFATGDSTCPVDTKYLLEEAEGQRIANSCIEIKHLIAGYTELAKDVDIIHDHTLLGPIYGPSVTDTPIVTTNHFPYSDDTHLIWEQVTQGRGKIISISHHHASLASPDTVVDTVIHHGVDISRFPDGAGEGGYLAFLGRMVTQKGVHTAVEVARKAGMPLKIAAKMREPREIEYFEKHVKPYLTSDIEYLGELGPKDKFELLSGAKALLNPIRWHEPFGMVMIESMACGTPVIVFPQGAAPEIVTDGLTGFVVNNEDEMVEAVGKVDQINRRACKFEVETRFSMKRMVQDHVDFYEKAIAESHTPTVVETEQIDLAAKSIKL